MNREKYTLSYSPKEGQVTKLSQDLYLEELDQIENIKEDSFYFHSLYIFEQTEKVEVRAFIINSTKKIANLELVPLVLVNENDQVITREILDLSEVGEIPSMNVRPVTLNFSKNNIKDISLLQDKCKILIDNKGTIIAKSEKISAGFIDDKFSLYEKKLVEQYIENMPSVANGVIDVINYKNGIDEENNKYSVLIVVNGTENNIAIGNFNIVFRDSMGMIRAAKKIETLPEAAAKSISAFKIIIEDTDVVKKPFNPEILQFSIE